MLRLSRLARAQRCYYQILGVPRDAPLEDIKRAFQEKAKMTHPDVAKGGDTAPKQFREMVEAYRILRDPKKRSEYDTEVGREKFRSPGQDSGQWPRGYGEGLSEETRAKMYSTGGGGSTSRRAAPPNAEARVEVTKSSVAPFVIMGAAGLFAVYNAVTVMDKKKLRDPDPYPSRLPAADAKAAKRQAAAAARAPASASINAADGNSGSVVEVALPAPVESLVPESVLGVNSVSSASYGGFRESRPEEDEKKVWAYYNPFGGKWQRIPEGFEPPASMDLTAWHKKQTDPVQWNRLLAEATLVELMPRGGLKVRYRPAWDTWEPILLKDPVTQKTVQVTEKLLKSRSVAVKECEVRF